MSKGAAAYSLTEEKNHMINCSLKAQNETVLKNT